jgi:hypothetical protein
MERSQHGHVASLRGLGCLPAAAPSMVVRSSSIACARGASSCTPQRCGRETASGTNGHEHQLSDIRLSAAHDLRGPRDDDIESRAPRAVIHQLEEGGDCIGRSTHRPTLTERGRRIPARSPRSRIRVTVRLFDGVGGSVRRMTVGNARPSRLSDRFAIVAKSGPIHSCQDSGPGRLDSSTPVDTEAHSGASDGCARACACAIVDRANDRRTQ